MNKGRNKSKPKAEQTCRYYALSDDIANKPCPMPHLEEIDFENAMTEEEKIKDAMKSLTGFGRSAEQAFKNFMSK